MSADSPKRTLRSSTKDIQRRKSIHEDKLNVREKSPLTQHQNQKEYSKSPVRKVQLYPDLASHLRESIENRNSDDDDNVEDHSFEQLEKSAQSDINVSKEPEKSSCLSVILISVLIVIVSILLIIKWPTSRGNEQKPLDLSDQIDCSKFFDLEAKYPQQNAKIFKSLKVSIEGIYNRNARPSVITFFSTDQKILDDLMKDVVYLTQKCIKQSNDPINLTYADLNIEKFLNDNSKIIGEYKNELEKRTILVINNLDELSSKVVPSLHSFTDTYNPLVQKSIIYISIRVPQKPVNPADIFTHLQNKWNDLASNIKNPLITRLLDQAFFLEPSY